MTQRARAESKATDRRLGKLPKPRRGTARGGVSGASNRGESATEWRDSRQPYRVSFVPDREMLERARNAVYALSGPPHVLTLTQLLGDALRCEVERLERHHHRGKPFRDRPGSLRPGRRVGGG